MKLAALVLSAAMALASACATAATGFIVLKDSAGVPLRAYTAGPEGARAGVLIVHDYFGISDFTKMAAERLGALGYRAIAIDLYGGRSATTHEAAVALMQALQAQDRAITDRTLQAGLEALKRPGRRLATLGFSMGGIEALQAALNDPASVQGVVVVYGFGFDQIDPARFARLQAPLLTITGGLDAGSVRASVHLLQRAGDLTQPVEAAVLPKLGHAYAQPLFDGGKGYSLEGTRDTWKLIDDFLARQLLPHGAPR